jgi:hypothetical protein
MPASKTVSDYFQSTCPRRNGKFQLRALYFGIAALRFYPFLTNEKTYDAAAAAGCSLGFISAGAFLLRPTMTFVGHLVMAWEHRPSTSASADIA